ALKILVVPPPSPRRHAPACILERAQRRQPLWKESRLHLFGNFQVPRRAALRLPFFRSRTASCFDRSTHFVEAHERERIAVYILETGEHTAPDRRLLVDRIPRRKHFAVRGGRRFIGYPAQPRCVSETNSATAPFTVSGWNIFGYKHDLGGAPDQLVLRRGWIGLNQSEHG